MKPTDHIANVFKWLIPVLTFAVGTHAMVTLVPLAPDNYRGWAVFWGAAFTSVVTVCLSFFIYLESTYQPDMEIEFEVTNSTVKKKATDTDLPA